MFIVVCQVSARCSFFFLRDYVADTKYLYWRTEYSVINYGTGVSSLSHYYWTAWLSKMDVNTEEKVLCYLSTHGCSPKGHTYKTIKISSIQL